MKIASWNVNSLNVRLPHLEQWLQAAQPDVVGLQETKLEDNRFPDAVLAGLGYRSVFAGQKTYNGVALLARGHALDDVVIGIPGFDDAQRRAIAATVNGIRIVNLYKLRWLDAVHGWIADELSRHPQLVVMGDFNIAPDDRDVHDPAVWNDASILTSTAERAALQRLLNLGLHDAYRLHHSEGGFFSWWDYRQAGFRRNLGLRIDLTLVSDALRDKTVAADIDREPRTWDRPSDHAPAWVQIA